jgi:hypothetical protein
MQWTASYCTLFCIFEFLCLMSEAWSPMNWWPTCRVLWHYAACMSYSVHGNFPYSFVAMFWRQGMVTCFELYPLFVSAYILAWVRYLSQIKPSQPLELSYRLHAAHIFLCFIVSLCRHIFVIIQQGKLALLCAQQCLTNKLMCFTWIYNSSYT